MDAGDLKIFATVARLGGMNRAAAELNTVQSNVTARIRLLEDELGAPLFDRHSRGVSLTSAGRRLLPYADGIAALLADARRAVLDDGVPRGSLTVGSLETTAAMRFAPVLARFAAAYPDVDLVLMTGTTGELVEKVLAHEVEGAFVCGPVNHRELEQMVAFRETLVLATAKSVRSLEELPSSGELKIVVLRAGCSYRQRLEAMLTRRGVVGLRRLEFGTIDGILGCVAAGLGVTLLPRGVISAAWRDAGVNIHDLPAREGQVETLFIRRSGSHLSSALSVFLRYTKVNNPQASAAQ